MYILCLWARAFEVLFMLVASRGREEERETHTKCTYVYMHIAQFFIFGLCLFSCHIRRNVYSLHTSIVRLSDDGSYAFEYASSFVSNKQFSKEKCILLHSNCRSRNSSSKKKTMNRTFENKLQTPPSEQCEKKRKTAKSSNIYSMNWMCVHSIIFLHSLSLSLSVSVHTFFT